MHRPCRNLSKHKKQTSHAQTQKANNPTSAQPTNQGNVQANNATNQRLHTHHPSNQPTNLNGPLKRSYIYIYTHIVNAEDVALGTSFLPWRHDSESSAHFCFSACVAHRPTCPRQTGILPLKCRTVSESLSSFVHA